MKISKTVFLFIILFTSFFINFSFAQAPFLKRTNLIFKNHINYSEESQKRTENYVESQGYARSALYKYILDICYSAENNIPSQPLVIEEGSHKTEIYIYIPIEDYKKKYPEQE